MRFVTYQKIATLLVLVQAPNVRSDGFVTADEDVEEFGPDEDVHGLLDSLAIGFGQGEGLDRSWSEPFDEFVIPIFHEGAGTNDNDSFGGGFSIGFEGSFQHGVDETNGLEGFAESHVVCEDAPVSVEVLHVLDALVHELYSFALMRSEPLGEDGGYVLVFGCEGGEGRWSRDCDFRFDAIFVCLHFGDSEMCA